MDKLNKILEIREKLSRGQPSIGSWIQIPHSSIAEIMGAAGFDWVAIDLEHGSVDTSQLPDLFRALELGGTLPLARISSSSMHSCKSALDAGAAGIIVPMIESAKELEDVMQFSKWPPVGQRGVGYSRANLFGKNFEKYSTGEGVSPLIIAMIENLTALNQLDEILDVEGLDAVFIGPYDLSASMNMLGQFDNKVFIDALDLIIKRCNEKNIACGIHVIDPDYSSVIQKISLGYRFVAFSLDSVFLNSAIVFPRMDQ